jgi:hypothetical protein
VSAVAAAITIPSAITIAAPGKQHGLCRLRRNQAGARAIARAVPRSDASVARAVTRAVAHAGKRGDSHHGKYCRDKDCFVQIGSQFHFGSPFTDKSFLMLRFNILNIGLIKKCATRFNLEYCFNINMLTCCFRFENGSDSTFNALIDNLVESWGIPPGTLHHRQKKPTIRFRE